MTVADLLEAIKDLDPSTQVILQKDSEGNGYSPLYATGMGYYVADSTWSGYVYDEDWTAADCCLTEEEWVELKEENPLVIVLAPIN